MLGITYSATFAVIVVVLLLVPGTGNPVSMLMHLTAEWFRANSVCRAKPSVSNFFD